MRGIDWNLYGRSGELHVKRFRDRTDLDVRVVVDRSASMGVDAGVKDVQARRVAAALAWGLAAPSRAVRVEIVDGDGRRPIGPVLRGSDGGMALLEELEDPGPCAGRLPASPLPLSRQGGRGEGARMVVFLSDFFDDLEPPLAALAASARVELTEVGIWSAAERDPRDEGRVRLADVEGADVLDVDLTPELRERYGLAFEARIEAARARAAAHRSRFVPVAAEAPFERVAIDVVRDASRAS